MKSIRFSREGKELRGTFDDGFSTELYPIGENRYLVLEPNRAQLIFIEEPGKPIHFEIHLGPMHIVGTRSGS